MTLLACLVKVLMVLKSADKNFLKNLKQTKQTQLGVLPKFLLFGHVRESQGDFIVLRIAWKVLPQWGRLRSREVWKQIVIHHCKFHNLWGRKIAKFLGVWPWTLYCGWVKKLYGNAEVLFYIRKLARAWEYLKMKQNVLSNPDHVALGLHPY